MNDDDQPDFFDDTAQRFKLSFPPTWERYLLSEAQAIMRGELEAEPHKSSCPCCGQHQQVYQRKLRAAWLSVLRYLDDNGSTHNSDLSANVIGKAHDWQFLEKWGFITSNVAKARGMWAITRRGQEFLAGTISVSAAVYVFQKNVVGWDAERISISDVEQGKFTSADIAKTAETEIHI